MSSRSSGRQVDPWDVVYHGARYAVWAALVLVIVLPYLYATSVSFRPPAEFFGDPHLIPYEPTLSAWTEAFGILAVPLQNSLMIATGVMVISLVITIPGAYVFARRDFPGKRIGFYGVLITLMFPYILLIVPITDLWYALNLFDTVPGLWIAYQVFVTPFAIWILRDFFEKLPANLEEAAKIYGCTNFEAFYRVILPLASPAIVATGFLAFLVGWNDFLFSNMLTTGNGPRPAVVSLFLVALGGESRWWARIMAMTLTIGTPPTILYLVARRQLTQTFALT